MHLRLRLFFCRLRFFCVCARARACDLLAVAQFNDEDFDIGLANWRLISSGSVRFKFATADVIKRKQFCVIAKGGACRQTRSFLRDHNLALSPRAQIRRRFELSTVVRACLSALTRQAEAPSRQAKARRSVCLDRIRVSACERARRCARAN